jgi:hypothetical protein
MRPSAKGVLKVKPNARGGHLVRLPRPGRHIARDDDHRGGNALRQGDEGDDDRAEGCADEGNQVEDCDDEAEWDRIRNAQFQQETLAGAIPPCGN